MGPLVGGPGVIGYLIRLDIEAEPKVGDGVVVLLDVGGISDGCSASRLFFEHAPATANAAAAYRSAGRPGRAYVGLADQVVDLHRGGLASQAGECPTAAGATGENFDLAIRQEFELGHTFGRERLWAKPMPSLVSLT